MRAVQVFGFHLATVDLRQSSDKHEAVVAELLRRWRASKPDYPALDEPKRGARCCSCVLDRRPLRVVESAAPRPTASSRMGELAIFEAAADDALDATAARRCATTSSRTPRA